MRDSVQIFAFCSECGIANTVFAEREPLGKYLLDQQTVQVLFYHMTAEEQHVIRGFRDETFLCGDCWNNFTEEME